MIKGGLDDLSACLVTFAGTLNGCNRRQSTDTKPALKATPKHSLSKYSKQSLMNADMGRCGVEPRTGGSRVFAQQIAAQGDRPLTQQNSLFRHTLNKNYPKEPLMKHHSRLILLTSLLAAFGMASCGNDSDTDNSETPQDCHITQAACDLLGATLDAANCICVNAGASQGNCVLTEAMCASANKNFDAANCICVDAGSSQGNCPLTEAMCASANKTLDVANCICITPETPQSCQFEDMTLSIGQKICGHDNTVITCLADGKLQKAACERGICTEGNCIDNSEQPQSCNPPCKADQICQNGVCTDITTPIACTTPNQVVCNGTCIDPMNSNEYCGASAACTGYNTCNVNETCQAGKCKSNECPVNQHMYQGSCEPDSVDHCGKHDYQCANEIDGWQDGECSQGQCSAAACIGNYHLYNHTCEQDSKEHCGEHNQDCRSSMPGFLDGQCINHQCIATECLQNYHLYQNTCEPDDETHCGKHTTNCSELIQGYATGKCVEKECYVNSCTDGYHLDSANNQCIADTNDCCGTSCSRCTSPRVCSKGSCETQCEAPLTKCNNECHNYAIDINHCGGCNNPCTTYNVSGSTDVTCTDSTCKAISCQSGYHVYEGTCETDDLENCGEHGNTCATGHSSMMNCKSGVCVVLTCNEGYHIYENTCEADSNANCGAHGTKCNVANATNTCSGGKCAFTCNPNYHTYDNGCEANDIENCGAHNKACSVANGTMTCESGKCVVKQCDSNYHIYGDICEADTTTNCGAHGKECNVANAATNTCSEGKCTFKCKDGYGKLDDACEPFFISKWNIDVAKTPVLFPIQGRSGTIIIDWGDGQSDTIDSGTRDYISHKYSSSRTYTIKVTGKINRWSCSKSSRCSSSYTICSDNPSSCSSFCFYYLNNNYAKNNTLISIQSYGNTTFDNYAFCNTELESLPTEGTPRFNNNEMIGVFMGAMKFNQNIDFWDTSNITNMRAMFYAAGTFNKPLNNWNTSNVTDMERMFSYAQSFNQPLNNWNTSKVTNMSYMFSVAPDFNQPLYNWNTSKVTDMSYMFQHASSFNQPLGNWNVSNVTNMSKMFSYSGLQKDNYCNLFKGQYSTIWTKFKNVLDISYTCP